MVEIAGFLLAFGVGYIALAFYIDYRTRRRWRIIERRIKGE